MNHRTVGLLSVALAVAAASHPAARGQALPTATQTFNLSVFGGATAAFTGLSGGRNSSFTAGANLGLHPFFRLYPSVTIRGTKPVDSGSVDGLENLLGGLQVQKNYGRFHPYADILYGRGQVNYVHLYPDPKAQYYYSASTSSVISPGGGLDLDLTARFALKGDVQYQHYDSPVTVSGSQYSTAVTLGVVYRLQFGRPGPRTR